MKGDALPHLLSFLSLYLGIPRNRFSEASPSSSFPSPSSIYVSVLDSISGTVIGHQSYIWHSQKKKHYLWNKAKKTKRDINMGEQMGQSGMWCLEHRSRQEERHSHCYCAHCDAASVWLPYGRSSGMNNAMISLSVFSVWLLATSGKGTKRRCTWGKTHPHFSFWHDSFSDRCGCAAFSL